MANPEHLAKITKGVDAWNAWRESNPGLKPDLAGAELDWAHLGGANLFETDLSGASLACADCSTANFRQANLRSAYLVRANLREADLFVANCCEANLYDAVLSEANLRGVNFIRANLRQATLMSATLTGANLSGADLSLANLSKANISFSVLTRAEMWAANFDCATLVGTDFRGADMSGAFVYGASIWDVELGDAVQKDLVITPPGVPRITVDNLDVAQFIYLVLNNAKIKDVIDTISSKAVLILGRFTQERKATLDALRDALRRRNYLPIVFDFEKPTTRDFTETVSTLAHLARFVIADLTDPRSVPQELTAIIPHLQSVPVRPLLRGDRQEWPMFRDFVRRRQVIEPLHYADDTMLLGCLESEIIEPAERLARELAGK